MITFNNELEEARSVFVNWTERGVIEKVTIIRDVFGKLAFFLENTQNPGKTRRKNLIQLLENKLNGYFRGDVYWNSNSDSKEDPPKQLVDILKMQRYEWCTEENIIFYVSERLIAKKAWIFPREEETPVWPYEAALEGTKPKVITFYSFKGGMGRTTALAATALLLARQGKNVMMIDTDIEAPGLSTLFFDDETIETGVLDYLIEHTLNKGNDITRYVKDVTDPALLGEDDGNLYLFPAGKVDEFYLQKLARIDYQDHCEGALKRSISELLEDIHSHYAVEYILIDARAGFHDLGGVAVAQIPHGSVLFGNSSRQSWEGMAQVIRIISESHSDLVPIAIVDCMCDSLGTQASISSREQFINKSYTVCLENYYVENEAVPGLEAENEAHTPIFLPFDDMLRQEITLFSTGSIEDNSRVALFAGRLTSPVYKEILNRMELWFGEGGLV